MMQKQPIDELYERFVVQPSAAYRDKIGEPVHLNPAAFISLLDRMSGYREIYPGMTFWLVVQYKTLTVTASAGEEEVFGYKLNSFKDFFRQMHPDYILPHLRWRAAAYDLIYRQSVKIDPLQTGYRQSVPLLARDGDYYWFTMYATITQLDAAGHIVTNMQTFYREGKWSARSRRPFEASVQIKDFTDATLEEQLFAQLSLHLIDEFTNAELDLLSLYASGKAVEEILQVKSWTRHTLHEYNANLLKKAKQLFVYEFRNAREFAEYCLEKGFIHLR